MTLTTVLEIFNPHLSDIKQACIDNMNHAIQQLDTPTNWVGEEVRRLKVLAIIEKPSRVVKRIVALQQPRSVSQAFNSITDAEIERAKEYPIEELYEGTLRNGGSGRQVGICPFHGPERTPSFYIFPENKAHCFGCSWSGDSIAFYMRNNGVQFIQAVKSLI